MNLEKRIDQTRSQHEKKWGSEDWIINNDKYCGKRLLLNRGYQCSVHYHELKEETFYINKGLVLLQVGTERVLMKPGQSLEIRPGERHRFIGITDAEIIEFSTKHMEDDSHRETQSGKVIDEIFNGFLAEYTIEIAKHEVKG